jgi:hypothetical protein
MIPALENGVTNADVEGGVSGNVVESVG